MESKRNERDSLMWPEEEEMDFELAIDQLNSDPDAAGDSIAIPGPSRIPVLQSSVHWNVRVAGSTSDPIPGPSRIANPRRSIPSMPVAFNAPGGLNLGVPGTSRNSIDAAAAAVTFGGLMLPADSLAGVTPSIFVSYT